MAPEKPPHNLTSEQEHFFKFLLCGPAMARSRPDPSVSVGDLMRPLESMCAEAGSYDLGRLCGIDSNMGWKTSADVSWLARDHIAKLFVGFFKIASNGVLSSKKLRSALVKLQTKKHRLNFGRLSDGDFFDKMDEQLRVAAKHYREMKKDSHTYRRAMKKASDREKQQIDLVLSYLDVEEPQTRAGTGPSTAAVTAELDTTAEKTGPGEETASSSADPVAASIFARVLSKKDSGEGQEPGQSAAGEEKASSSKASSSVRQPVAKRAQVAVSYEELLASYGLDSDYKNSSGTLLAFFGSGCPII